MLKLSKKVEYAILAMQYMAMFPDELINAKQIAKDNNLSFEFLSKSLQILNRKGLINSVQGVRGGYNLAKNPRKISVSEIIKAMDQNSGIVDCTVSIEDGADNCSRTESCIMKNPMNYLQKKINEVLENTTVYEFTKLANNNISNSNNFLKISEIEIKN